MSNKTIINGDCLSAMRGFKNNQFDLAICDPEYGINIAKTGKVGGEKLAPVTDYGAKDWDKEPPSQEYFDELRRVSKNQIIWGANHFIRRIAIDSSCWVVWDKNNSGNFADCELAWTSFNTAVRMFSYTWNGMIQGNMKKKEHRIHPTQKPVNLYTWLLKNYAKEGDHILDTHAGSMSSVIACLDMGFKITAYEIDEDYFDAGCRRVEEHVKQLRLF